MVNRRIQFGYNASIMYEYLFHGIVIILPMVVFSVGRWDDFFLCYFVHLRIDVLPNPIIVSHDHLINIFTQSTMYTFEYE